LPGNLYSFEDEQTSSVVLKVNGSEERLRMKDGYACIEREWKTGDQVMIDFPMQVRKIVANRNVKADNQKIALQRGPLVYCAEGIDNPEKRVLNIILDNKEKLTAEAIPGLLNGIHVIKGQVKGTYRTKEGNVEIRNQPFVAIPYFAWANRGASEMSVWFGTTEDRVLPVPQQTIASRSILSALHPGKNLAAVNNLYFPKSSNDHEIAQFDWWPRRDTLEWIQYSFEKEESITKSSVYWFDDRTEGDCRIPDSWRILYRSGDSWIPVKNVSAYSIERDQFCTVSFEPVTAIAIRLEVVLPKEHSSGLYQWSVE
jgi:hypothetical protein